MWMTTRAHGKWRAVKPAQRFQVLRGPFCRNASPPLADTFSRWPFPPLPLSEECPCVASQPVPICNRLTRFEIKKKSKELTVLDRWLDPKLLGPNLGHRPDKWHHDLIPLSCGRRPSLIDNKRNDRQPALMFLLMEIGLLPDPTHSRNSPPRLQAQKRGLGIIDPENLTQPPLLPLPFSYLQPLQPSPRPISLLLPSSYVTSSRASSQPDPLFGGHPSDEGTR